jgi:hypothetical protein
MTAPQLAPATVVAGKYQVGACLGYAGSSATYQAIGADGREVVLKLFDPAIRQRADIMAALEQTYAATNALPHEIAVPLLDAGYDPATGAPFSVSERIPFPSLAQIAAQRPLTPEETTGMLGALAQLLDQAHPRQLFHHALKPTNVFVGLAQRYGVRVTDFGAGLVRTAVPTQEGYALAAPWLAPEQVQGGAPAGGAADVFTTALLVFYALTGRSYWRACQGQLDLAGWQREVMSPRTPPSARALQLGVTLSSAFDGVLGCALSLDPGQRYRSIGELTAAIDQVVSMGAPASQSTMAFPTGAMGMGGRSGGDYPPPPPPSGGLGMPQQQAAPTLASAYAQAQAMQSMQGMQGPPPVRSMQPSLQGIPGQPPIPGPAGQGQPPGAYVSMQSPSAEASLGETAAGRPIDPAVLARRPSSNRWAPILVGLMALVLLGVGATAWVIMSKRSRAEQALADSTAASASAAPAGPADTGSAAPSAAPADTGSAAPSAAPADTGSAAPSAEPSAAPSASASADANAGTDQAASIVCDPADCDEIKIDDKAVDMTQPIIVPPGKHTIGVFKTGYSTFKEIVMVKAGEKLDRTYHLTLKPTGPVVQGPPKPCGKFLKRCK